MGLTCQEKKSHRTQIFLLQRLEGLGIMQTVNNATESPMLLIAEWSHLFNISTRRVGGIRFLKIGRFTFSFCVARSYKSL